MVYFDQLTEEANPAQEKFRHVLALLLLQKRRLKLEGSRLEDNIEYLQFVSCQDEGTYEVRDFQLTEQEMNELQDNLNAHFTEEWS